MANYKSNLSYIIGFLSAGLDTKPQTGESRPFLNPFNPRTDKENHFLCEIGAKEFYCQRTLYELNHNFQQIPQAVSQQRPEQKRRPRKSLTFWIDSQRKQPIGINS